MLAVGCRRMHIVERLERAAAFAGLAQEFDVRRMADERGFQLARPHRAGAHAAQRNGRAGDPAGAIDLKQRRGRHNGEIAVAAGEFHERIAVLGGPRRKLDRGQHFDGLDRRGEIGDRKILELDFALAAWASHHHGSVERHGAGDKLSRWIEMAQRAPDGAAIAGLTMADALNRLVHQREPLFHQIGEFEIALACHGADFHAVRSLADIGEPLDPVEIDDVVGLDVTEIQHRHQRLPAGQQLGVFKRRQQADDFGDRLRVVVAEGRWLHLVSLHIAVPVYQSKKGTITIMKPASFRYHAPKTIEQALAMLAEYAPDDGCVLAGGQSLVPTMAFRLARPHHLVDINGIEALRRLGVEQDKLVIGAGVRHQTFHRPVVEGPLGVLLSAVMRHIAHYPIRTRGTFCGSLAHADPASEWCLAAATLGAEMAACSTRGTRKIAAADFFAGLMTTALAEDELLVEARLPLPATDTRCGFYEFSRRA